MFFLYYLFASGTLGASALGFYYLYDRNGAEGLMYSATWKCVTLYARVEDFYYKRISPTITSLFESENNSFESTFVRTDLSSNKTDKITIHNLDTDKYEILDNVTDNINFDWGFKRKKINNDFKCRIFEDWESINNDFKNIEKPFLQVELEQNGEKKEIHEYLHYFYLDGNKILDKAFLKWYMNYWYQMDLANTYKLHIIDNNINIFTLGTDEYIILNDNAYDIKK